MQLRKNFILVNELKDDIIVDGILTKYDDNNNFMFVEVIQASNNAYSEISQYTDPDNVVLVISRIAKTPFLTNYVITLDDVLMLLTKEEYNKLIKGDM